MNLSRSFLVMTMACLTLAGCGDVRESLGLGRSAPDEFAVIDRPPLVIPPDFGLRPPVPGAPRPQEVDPSAQANSDLFAGKDKSAPVAPDHKLSAAEQALMSKTGADQASPDIRATINSESTSVVEESPHLVDELLTWKKNTPDGAVVDAAGEAERIKEAKDNGDPLNKTATPVIEKEKSSWLGL